MATSGMTKQDVQEVAKRPLDFDLFCYYRFEDNTYFDTHFESFERAKEWGFKVPEHSRICKSREEIMDYIDYWNASS